MNRIIILSTFMLTSFLLQASVSTQDFSTSTEDTVWAHFTTFEDSLNSKEKTLNTLSEFIHWRLKNTPRTAGLQLEFVVDKNGVMHHFKILKGIADDYALDIHDAFTRTVYNYLWTPSSINGTTYDTFVKCNISHDLTSPKTIQFEMAIDWSYLEEEEYSEEELEQIFTVVEQMPRFQGCNHFSLEDSAKRCTERALLEFIYKNLIYPPNGYFNAEGINVLQFIINKDGTIKNVRVFL